MFATCSSETCFRLFVKRTALLRILYDITSHTSHGAFWDLDWLPIPFISLASTVKRHRGPVGAKCQGLESRLASQPNGNPSIGKAIRRAGAGQPVTALVGLRSLTS